MKKNIAKEVVIKCGGAKIVAAWCSRHVSRVYEWMERGYIPSRHQSQILTCAKAENKDLTEKDFF
jgi:hypothetical protein